LCPCFFFFFFSNALLNINIFKYVFILHWIINFSIHIHAHYTWYFYSKFFPGFLRNMHKYPYFHYHWTKMSFELQFLTPYIQNITCFCWEIVNFLILIALFGFIGPKKSRSYFKNVSLFLILIKNHFKANNIQTIPQKYF